LALSLAVMLAVRALLEGEVMVSMEVAL